jgi:hypothetical protein
MRARQLQLLVSNSNHGARLPAPLVLRRQHFPYRVELWDAAKRQVERTLALTLNGGVAYASYFAALREHPGRYITLSMRDVVLCRINTPRTC